MNVLFVNGSPRGRFSVTLQSCLYLEKRFPRHSFQYLNAGAGIDAFERDMAAAAAALALGNSRAAFSGVMRPKAAVDRPHSR